MRIRDEFWRRYRDVDAIVVAILWDCWRRTHDQQLREDIEAALRQLQDNAEVNQFGARRRGAPSRGPVAVPDPRPRHERPQLVTVDGVYFLIEGNPRDGYDLFRCRLEHVAHDRHKYELRHLARNRPTDGIDELF